jgi:hypothetical protein
VRREKGSIVRNCIGALATSNKSDVLYLRLCLTLDASNVISGASRSSRVRPTPTKTFKTAYILCSAVFDRERNEFCVMSTKVNLPDAGCMSRSHVARS